jgi:hypothetical protein
MTVTLVADVTFLVIMVMLVSVFVVVIVRVFVGIIFLLLGSKHQIFLCMRVLVGVIM